MRASRPEPLSVVLCGGSDCARDERRAHRCLAQHLEDAGIDVTASKCLGVCHGPVVVAADEHGTAVVLHKVRSKQRRRQLVSAIAGGDIQVAAEAVPTVEKRKRRDRALRRAGRVLPVELTPQ